MTGARRLLALLLVGLAAAPLAAWLAGNAFLLGLATRSATLALAAVSLQFIVGYGGLLSLGHAAFLGIGAYALLVLGSYHLDGAAISLPAALLASALFAWPTGWVALRARGVALLMITLAFGQMAYFAAGALAAFGGDDGLALDRLPPPLGNPLALHFTALACLFGAVAGSHMLGGSRYGRVLRAARDNPLRIAALGYDVTRVQLIAYVLSGAVAGLAGWLLAVGSGFVSPALLDWRLSGELLVMVILGGAASPEGAAIGAVALVLLQEGLAAFTEHGRLALGAVLLLAALWRIGRRA